MKKNRLVSRLRKRVAIETPVRVSDDAGGFTESWQEFITVFAEIEPVSGKEKLVTFKMQEEVSHKITIRYVAGVTAKMRISLEGRLFNIRAVINVSEMKERLLLLCDEGAGI